MRIPDVSAIDLSDKYQRLFEKYVEQTDAPVTALENVKERYNDEKSIMKDLMSDVRAARLEYISIKRSSIMGTLKPGQTQFLENTIERIKTGLTDAAQYDRKYSRLLRDLNYKGLDKMLSKHSSVSENNRISVLKEKDPFQMLLDSTYSNAKTNITKLSRRMQSTEIKIERKANRALLDQYNFKISLSNLDSFENSANYMLRSFGINND